LNFLRRTFVNGYSAVCCQLPFQDHERLIVIVWGAVCVVSLAFQLWRESGRPPFPASDRPTGLDRMRLEQRYLLNDNTQSPFLDNRRINDDYNDENSPLIAREEVDLPEPSAPPTSQALESRGQVVGYIQGYGAVTSQSVSPIFRAAASRDSRFTGGGGNNGTPADPRDHQLMQRGAAGGHLALPVLSGSAQMTASSTSAGHSLNSYSDGGSLRPSRTVSPGGTIVTVVNRPPRYLPKKKRGAGGGKSDGSVPKDIFKPPDLDSQLSQS